MPRPRGRTLSLSPSRRVQIDLLELARRIPAVPIERTMRLAPSLVQPVTASHQAIFIKAFGLVSANHSLLRRCYIPWPRSHLYEHPLSSANVPVVRITEDAEVLMQVQIAQPETLSIQAIDNILRRHRDAPLEQLSAYQRSERLGRCPGFVRRWYWRLGMGWSGRFHAAHFGTFALSPCAGLGVDSLHPLSLFAPTINHGSISADGTVEVRLVYDHRVLDGVSAAQALAQLEQVLNREIAAELSSSHEEAA